MRIWYAIAFVASLCLAEPAHAQFGWGQLGGPWFESLPQRAIGHWRACTNEGGDFSGEQAVEGCNRLLAEDLEHRDQASAYWWRSYAHRRAGSQENAEADLVAAAAAYSAWLAENDADVEAYHDRARLYIQMREFHLALADYAAADRILPRRPQTYDGRGRIAFLQGDYANAITQFDFAQRLVRRSTVGISYEHRRCEARAAAGVELDIARAACERIVRLSDYNPWTLVSRGYFRFRQNDLSGAASDFARALDSDPINAAALYGRGVILVMQGRTPEGEADIAQARQIDPYVVSYYEGAGLRP